MNTNDPISIPYQKFFAKFKDINTLDIKNWDLTHILAYFCKRYKEYYNFDFTFSFKGTPSKCREIYEIKKLSHMISSNSIILKSYIDWIFIEKIIQRKKKVTSLAYITYPDIVNEYKFKFLFTKKGISRSDTLPENISSICNKYGVNDITTYGHLAFLKKMPNHDTLIQEIQASGFNIDILDRIQ